jgi:hypothetical protein
LKYQLRTKMKHSNKTTTILHSGDGQLIICKTLGKQTKYSVIDFDEILSTFYRVQELCNNLPFPLLFQLHFENVEVVIENIN